MDKTWLCHYDPETKQQSMEWRHGGSPRPKKIPSAKIRWKSSRLLINYLPKGQTINADATEGQFEGQTPREGHQGDLVLARQCPGSPGTCNPEETGLPELPMS